MKRRFVPASLSAAVAMATAVALGAAPAGAGPITQPVTIEFQAFAPSQLDALPGDTVQWSNPSVRTHTVTADDGSFDSGDLVSGSDFDHAFGAPGVYLYHCTIHPGMLGEVDVRRVTLDSLSAGPVPPGQRVTFTGRSADGSAAVTVQQAIPGGYRTVASATPTADGRWSATVTATSTADYRASSGNDASETRRLLVVSRRAVVRVTRHGVAVTVTPPDAGASVVLELFLRERFGWWPVERARLDYLSRAEFRVRGPARARVALVDRDGLTALSTSRVVHLRRTR
ncbi:MAG: cupredoxin domain-containing protein [Solirubrobacteraceae bacterium]